MNKEKEEGKFFFSHVDDNVNLTEVIEKIDNNKRTLKKIKRNFILYLITLPKGKSDIWLN